LTGIAQHREDGSAVLRRHCTRRTAVRDRPVIKKTTHARAGDGANGSRIDRMRMVGTGSGAFDPLQAMSAAWDVWATGSADAATIARRARARLHELLRVAQRSPLYRKLHANATGTASAEVPLEALPPVSRSALMARFDDWSIDRAVTLESATAFLADADRVGDAYLARYAIWTSSGTTGTPGIYVQDARALAVYDALETLRFRGMARLDRVAESFARMAASPWGGGERFAMLGATGGHFAGNASVERMRRLSPWNASRIRMISIMQPLDAIVAELNAFRPTVLATYPTAAELLAGEQTAGRLELAVDEIWTGGEKLGETTLALVERAFGCRVRDAYGASEFMAIGSRCDHGATHVNSDWVLLEPVDRNMQPVDVGTPSHTVLLTNLANHVQPLIRYDLGDTVTMLGRCACGSALPAIHIEGRTDDVLEFEGPDRSRVSLLPLALVTVLEDEAGVFEFQLLQQAPDTLALRIAEPTRDGHAVRGRSRQALRHFLESHGLGHVQVIDDLKPPARNPVSGKLRRIVRAVEQVGP
jgi:phenylacetate-CoA ligase